MDISVAERLLDELVPSLEALEAQNTALLHFLKDKGIVADDQLAPYLEQAAAASNVRWRAARLRFKGALSSHMKSAEQSSGNDQRRSNGKESTSAKPEKGTGTGRGEEDRDTEVKEQKGREEEPGKKDAA